MIITVEQIAEICHEANAAYCRTIGDDSQPAWVDAPNWQRESAVEGVQHIIDEWRGGLGRLPQFEDQHKQWLARKESEGWTYGEIKDVEAKTHPCMVPYDELPEEQQRKGKLFQRIVTAFL